MRLTSEHILRRSVRLASLGALVALAACGSAAKPGGAAGGGSTGSSTPVQTTGDSNTAVSPPLPVTPAHCVTSGTVDVNITVTSKAGPKGAAAPVAFDNNVYSQNLYDVERDDYVPHASDKFVAYLKALRPGMIRFPAGYHGQTYQFTRTGPEGMWQLTPALIAAYMELCGRVGAKPYMAVNIETGTVAMAADLVRFVNIEQKYGVTWWQVGNEPDVSGVVPGVHSPQIYAAKVNAFVAAMKAVDPTIKIVGGEMLSGENLLGQRKAVDWLTPIMQAAGSQLDAIAWHYYPVYSYNPNNLSSANGTIAHLLQEDAQDWPPAGLDFADTVMPHLAQIKAQYRPSAQVWIDEFAEDPGPANGQGTGNISAGALWAADAMGRYMEYGTNAIFKFIFKGGPEHYYTLVDINEDPRPEYYTYWMYAQHFGDHMVQTTSDQIWAVNAHAAVRAADGSLRVMLINKRDVAQNVRLKLADFTPTAAGQLAYAADSVSATSATVNGQTLTMANIGQDQTAIPFTAAEACTDNIVTVPAYSTVMLIFGK